MKKAMFLTLIIGIVFAFTTTPASAQWVGEGSGYVDTATNTFLNVGTMKTGCGDACNFGKSYFMEAQQAGSLSIGAKGYERNPDLVRVDMSGGYDTGYEQAREIPGGFQRQYGEQWGSGKITLKSR
ncbi:MAG: hypothetical protein WC906_00985 [Parcubacteria group bacterium]|jgi:hypothetical protein